MRGAPPTLRRLEDRLWYALHIADWFLEKLKRCYVCVLLSRYCRSCVNVISILLCRHQHACLQASRFISPVSTWTLLVTLTRKKYLLHVQLHFIVAINLERDNFWGGYDE